MNMSEIYGYCRISTKYQNIDRQERNILAEYPNAIIVKETYTGKKVEGREKFEKLIGKVKQGDTIVFDSVSRMSRDAEKGFALYKELYNKGVNLVFLKEHYIDTDTYKKAFDKGVEMTGTNVDSILMGINEYLFTLAEEQVKMTFEQAQKEVDDLSQRTKEGLITAKMNGKQIGNEKGVKLTTKKSLKAKEQIKKYNKDFGGSLNDKETIKMVGIARNTYYKYKKELLED